MGHWDAFVFLALSDFFLIHFLSSTSVHVLSDNHLFLFSFNYPKALVPVSM